MSDLTTKVPEFAPRFLRTSDAVIYVGLSPRTLEKHRTYGTGPSFHKLGGRAVYTLEDLDRWADQGLRRSTCDPGIGTVHPARKMTLGREAGRSAK
ncbi:helix-turn-helix transcriptional regulator [Novosphingobium colocasiae]|uniref:helix-turn-helix transcriptional regulator n=1 Tax=Novosphingobium colocasiae TaxID=1256513 RepID=UPI0035AF7D30